MSQSLNCCYNCSNSRKTLYMSTLLVFPSIKDIDILFYSFYTYSSLQTSFKASSHTFYCLVTLASCCANALHFILSLLYNPYKCSLFLRSISNSFFRQDFSKTHSPRSCSNFFQSLLNSNSPLLQKLILCCKLILYYLLQLNKV